MDKKNNIEKVNFDLYADNYDNIMQEQLDFFGEENEYFAEYKVKIVKDNLKVMPEKILEFGCGIGRNLKFFSKYFPEAELYGCDVSAKSMEYAKALNSSVNFFTVNSGAVEKYKGVFNLVFVSCVFHHIHPGERNDSMRAIYEMLKPNSALYIFEHNPYNPVTRYIVNTCPWDTDAILLKPNEAVALMKSSGLSITEKKFTLYLPASFKKIRFIENYLGKIPLGGQYYVKGVKRS